MAISLATVGGKITAAFMNLIITTVNTQGLTAITSTSWVGASGGFANADNSFTLGGTTALSANGCFTSAFENYVVLVNCSSKSAAVDMELRLRAGGVDSTVSYRYSRNTVTSALSANQNLAASSALVDAAQLAGSTVDSEIKLFRPALAAFTTGLSVGTTYNTTPSLATWETGFAHQVAASFDGFTLSVSAGSMTQGRVRVYGINGT